MISNLFVEVSLETISHIFFIFFISTYFDQFIYANILQQHFIYKIVDLSV